MSQRFFFGLLVCLLLAPAAARAQSRTDGHKFEVGAAFDSELVHYPRGGGGDFGETQGLFGVRAGRRFDKVPVGLFVKARPGFLHLAGAFAARNPALGQTRFALDLGGVVELYPSRRATVRVDYGDTLVAFGDTPVNSALAPPRSRGTTHNKQVSFGVGYRF